MAKNFGIEIEFMLAGRPPSAILHPRLSGDDRWPDSEGYHDIYDTYPASLDSLKVCEALTNCNLPVACRINPGDLQDPLTKTPEGDLVKDSNGTYITHTGNLEDPEHPLRKAGTGDVCRVWNKELAKENFPGQQYHLGQQDQFRYWFVADEHIPNRSNERPPTDHSWNGMEISSPVISDQKEIDAGLPTLKRVLEALSNSLLISLTSDCGLHIHGSPSSGSIDLQLAKKVIAVIRLLEEPFIQKICHPLRRNSPSVEPIGSMSILGKKSKGNKTETASSCGGFIQTIHGFRSKLQNRSPNEPDAFRFMEFLFAAKTIDSLREDLKSGTSGTNMPHRCGIAITLLGTVEFRYPQSSFDPEWPAFWVKLMQKIFQICVEPDEAFSASFERLYELGTRAQAVGWESWLEELGLSSQYREVCARHIHEANSPRKNEILPKVGGI
ncbi:hypothetical protein J3459_008385 [Metarhizium acridum]|uniref:uncharacterized protein n=1 Tax=Metarhizium acridum TaxID=92637 RepID=UPI001C6B8F1D|nr:hypothetical protein J3458_000251 [Metarhizium acridum]KAG8426158.1 hypothetical protein J3459_008385 [Metarhizium acridum]